MDSKKASNVPGLERKSEEDGNFGDIAKAGSLHQFLLGLHKQFGPIASFWWGKIYVVSIASWDLFEEHQYLHDKPPELFRMFEPLWGPKSLPYAVGDDGKRRRQHYDKAFEHEAVRKYFPEIQQVANEVADEWSALLEKQKLPLSVYACEFALKATLFTLFGKHMRDEVEIRTFKRKYDEIVAEMEMRLTTPPTEEREKTLQEDKKYLIGIVQRIVNERKAKPEHGEEVLLDALIDFTDDEELQFSESVVYAYIGLHLIGTLLTWALYLIATHPDVEQKILEEVQNVLGDKDESYDTMKDLVYLRQVLDETLRCSVVAPWEARIHAVEQKLGGYDVPLNTPVIHALGVSYKDDKQWPDPDRFDPERFSKENKATRSKCSFPAFGFAGNRVCPADEYTYANATVALVTLLRRFKVHVIEGQKLESVYDPVSHPKEEIWVNLSRRYT